MKRPEIVTAYYLCQGLWTVIPSQMGDDFREMADCGFTAVAISFSESEATYARRTFELQVSLAHGAGLKVFAIPSRFGGRFAGAPLMPGLWLANNPEHAIPRPKGYTWLPLACLESEEFLASAREFLDRLTGDYEIDGFIWDEPKGVEVVSTHPATVKKLGRPQTPEQAMDGFVSFLRGLIAHCDSVRAGLTHTLFCFKHVPPYFSKRAAAIPGLHYHGYDGTLSKQSLFHEEPFQNKYRLEEVWDRTVREAGAAGKKTYALVENILIPRGILPEFEEGFERFLQEKHPDHLAAYFYGHNNEEPDAVHACMKRLMKKYL